MNAKTLEAITKHGNALLAAFPNSTEKDPIALCKKLKRIENAISTWTTKACNEPLPEGKLNQECAKALERVCKLLGVESRSGSSRIMETGLFINRDPRGYALKLDYEWVREWNKKQYEARKPAIHTDMGGYGILAPELNTK